MQAGCWLEASRASGSWPGRFIDTSEVTLYNAESLDEG
jgi:hypothetical protein